MALQEVAEAAAEVAHESSWLDNWCCYLIVLMLILANYLLWRIASK